MPDLDLFGLEFKKNYCHISNQHSQICHTAKFCEGKKMHKFGNENALIGYFLAGI